MNQYHITKWQGLGISLLLFIPYALFYHSFFGGNTYSLHLTTMFMFGVMLNFFQKIEPGTEAELVFFGKATGFFWSDGPALVPTIFPFLHHVGVYLLWSLKKPVITDYHTAANNENFNVHHMQDQRLARYNVNTQTSLLAANFDRMLSNIFGWIFGFKRGDPELLFQRLGFRIMLLAIILGFGANTYFGIKNSNFIKSSMSVASDIVSPIGNIVSSFNHAGTIAVLVSLERGLAPAFPTGLDYIISQDNSDEPYYINSQAPLDTRPYYRFKESLDNQYPIRHVSHTLCQVIPQEKKMGFVSRTRPVYALNMENRVIYMKKGSFLTLPERLVRWIKNNTSYKKYDSMPAEDTLGNIYSNWHMVDTDDYTVIMKALDQKEMPVGATVGMVCF